MNLSKKQQFLINISAAAVLLFVIIRWFFLIDKYSVNMLFWDQWDFMGGLFEQKGPWELFSWQHGPHRQGVGFFLTKIVAELSGWNTRVECFMIGSVICLAALTALFLKRQITGNITAFDLAIPLLYLSPLQFELFANTPNVSHGAMPLLLITLFCLCWTIENITLRYPLCSVINFMTLYTGFGIFIGCVTPLLFLSELALAVKNKDSTRKILAVVVFLIAVASIASFFLNYTFNSAAEGFVFPHPHPFIYVKFILIAFATFVGMRMSHVVLYFIAAPIIFYMLHVVFRSGKNIVTSVDDKEVHRNQIIIVLIIFTLIFSLNLAIGRACLGLGAAAASRYIPYMTPGFFALYLFAVTKKKVPEKVLFFCITLFFTTTMSIGTANKTYCARLCGGKERWKQAYLKTENIERSTELSGFMIYPNPKATNLKWKLDHLKKNRLNLYLDASE